MRWPIKHKEGSKMPAKQPNDAIGAVMPKDLQAFEGALGDAPDAGVPVEPGAEAVPGGSRTGW